MKKLFFSVLLSLLVNITSQAQAQVPGDDMTGYKGPIESKNKPFIIDPADYPGATHFIFLETKTKQLTKDYAFKVKQFVDVIAAQPGFRASMILEDIDLKHIVVYYQFETEDQWKAARQNSTIFPYAGAVQAASSRFEDFATQPLEQGTINPDGSPNPPPGYYAKFFKGDGLAINEATVNTDQGRTQEELTRLMRSAGIVANPNTAPGYKDFTFHQALDGSRNLNLLHWSSVRTMTDAALNTLVQPLINGGLTGGTDGWGPTGPGKIHVHIYNIVDILNGQL